MSCAISFSNPRLRHRRLARLAMLALVPALVLWLLGSISAVGQFRQCPESGALVPIPRPQATWLIDDTHLWRPTRPEPGAAARFQIVTAGAHVILLDSHLGNTWLLRPGESGKDDRPEWILIFREVLDDQRRPPAPETDDPQEEDTEDDDFDPFGP